MLLPTYRHQVKFTAHTDFDEIVYANEQRGSLLKILERKLELMPLASSFSLRSRRALAPVSGDAARMRS